MDEHHIVITLDAGVQILYSANPNFLKQKERGETQTAQERAKYNILTFSLSHAIMSPKDT